MIIQTVSLGAGNMTRSYNRFSTFEMAINALIMCKTIFGTGGTNYTDKHIVVTVRLNFAINIAIITARAGVRCITMGSACRLCDHRNIIVP